MKISSEEYERFREWFAVVWPIVFDGMDASPDADPVIALDHIAAKSPARARQGLAMAIGDIVEATSDWRSDAILQVDQRLSAANLPSFSDVRMRFSRTVEAILGRRRIANDREYFAIRNVADGMRADKSLVWELLATYENRTA